MRIPFAINGLGRVGRALVRIARRRPELRLVAVNDRADAGTLARLVAHDSVHGRFPGEIEADGGALLIGEDRVEVFRESEVEAIPWDRTPAQIVVEATGAATRRELAARHLRGEVCKVVISALAADTDFMLCLGINSGAYDPDVHHVVSNASCTTNCLALLLDVLHRRFGVRHALMNEVHSYTANQRLVDGIHPDPRRARAAAMNIVPTTTAAPAAAERLLPELQGRIAGQAVRVPTPNVALLDLAATLERPADAAAVNDAFYEMADTKMKGLLAVSDEPLVSTDYIGDPHSAIVDLLLTESIDGELARVVAWYDNEWGYTNRLADLLTLIGGSL
ncbi:MAG: type I glyceraldehyde-3-phosphate dehydrogenase [bacterium]|nr:type I glyceraldehyde-3-phosphate dehydrogenase [bacterium]